MDTNLGGTKDIEGSSGWADGWLTVEMVHPLNSGDSAGNDPFLYPGDAVIAEFMAMDPEVEDADYGVAMKETAYMFNLVLAPCQRAIGGELLPFNIMNLMNPNLVTLAMVAATTITLLKKKQK